MHYLQEIVEAIQEILQGRARGAMATVTETSNSTPQRPGSRLLLLPDGRFIGTVGGGAIEHRIEEVLLDCIAKGVPETLRFDLGELGMSCGGSMSLFVEPIEPAPALVIFGAGHVAKPTAQLAKNVGFAVTIVDERESLNTNERFSGCRRIVSPIEIAIRDITQASGSRDKENARRQGPGGPAPCFLILTHDHSQDERALNACLNEDHSYIGMIGSKRKVRKILDSINKKSAGSMPSLERLYAPVGIDIGASSPEELALSIVAELIALKNHRKSSHLRVLEEYGVSLSD